MRISSLDKKSAKWQGVPRKMCGAPLGVSTYL